MTLTTGYSHREMLDTDGASFKMRVLQFGSVELHDIAGLARIWNLTNRYGNPRLSTVVHMLNDLLVPIVDMPDGHTYYSPAELEKAILFVSQLGGPGFLAPGSRARRNSLTTRSRWCGVYKLDPAMVREYKDLITAAIAEKTEALRKEAYKHARKIAKRTGAEVTAGAL